MPPIDTDTEHDEITPAERETQPPTAASEPPPGFDPKPSDALKKMLGYDENVFLHAALMAAADAAHEMRQASKSKSDIKALLETQTEKILQNTGANIELVRSGVAAVQQSVDALVIRVGNNEQELARARDEGSERFQKLELDMAVMRTQMDRFDRELAVIKATQDAKKPE
jgi:hypothetical protein